MSNSTAPSLTPSLSPSKRPTTPSPTVEDTGVFGLGPDVDLYIFIGGGVGICLICVLLIGIICLLRSDPSPKHKKNKKSQQNLKDSQELQQIATVNSISAPLGNNNLGGRNIAGNANINSFMSSVQRQNFPSNVYQPPPQGFRNRNSIDAWNGVVRNPPINHMKKLPDGRNVMDLSLNPQVRQQELLEQHQIQQQLARDAEMALKLYQEQLRQFGVDEDLDPGQVEGGETGFMSKGEGPGPGRGRKKSKKSNASELEEGDPETIEEEERQIKEAMVKSKKEEEERKKKEEEEDQRRIEAQEKKEKELLLKKKEEQEKKKQEQMADNFQFQGYGADNKEHYSDLFNNQDDIKKPPSFDMPEEYQNMYQDNYNNDQYNNNYYNNNNNGYGYGGDKPPPPPPPKKKGKPKPKKKIGNKKSGSKVLNAASMFNKINDKAQQNKKPIKKIKKKGGKKGGKKVKIPNAPPRRW